MDAKTVKALIDAVCAVTTDKMTLEIAEWVTMSLPGRKRATEFLHHYLGGSGLPKYVKIEELFRDDPGLRELVLQTIAKELKAVPPRRSGRVPIPQSAYARTPAAGDWRYALGSINMDWKVVSGPQGGPLEVELSFKNEYRWHPKAPRISQCVHQAAEDLKVKGARDFWMYGSPYRIKLTSGPIRP